MVDSAFGGPTIFGFGPGWPEFFVAVGVARLVDIFIAGRPFGVLALYFGLYFIIYLGRIIRKDCRD